MMGKTKEIHLGPAPGARHPQHAARPPSGRCRAAAWLRRLVGLTALAVVCAWSGGAGAGAAVKALPWHLSDVHFEYADPVPFRSLSVAITVDGNVEPGHAMYFALYGSIGASAYYFGLQTDLDDPRTPQADGKGVIFSRWGGTSLDEVRAPQESWAVGLTGRRSGEGDFVSVRRSYPWTAGTYVFALNRVPDSLPDGGGRWGMWVELKVRRQDQAVWTDIGTLRFADANGTFRSPLVAFVEHYGPASAPATFADHYAPPAMAVGFSVPNVAGAPVLKRVTAITGPSLPLWAKARWTGAGASIVVTRTEPLGTTPVVSDVTTASVIYDARMAPAAIPQ